MECDACREGSLTEARELSEYEMNGGVDGWKESYERKGHAFATLMLMSLHGVGVLVGSSYEYETKGHFTDGWLLSYETKGHAHRGGSPTEARDLSAYETKGGDDGRNVSYERKGHASAESSLASLQLYGCSTELRTGTPCAWRRANDERRETMEGMVGRERRWLQVRHCGTTVVYIR